MAQGRSTEIVSMIKWIRTSRLPKDNSLSAGADPADSGVFGNGPGVESQGALGAQGAMRNRKRGWWKSICRIQVQSPAGSSKLLYPWPDAPIPMSLIMMSAGADPADSGVFGDGPGMESRDYFDQTGFEPRTPEPYRGTSPIRKRPPP